MQEKMIFPVRKLMNYLVVPNNLLLSLSLSSSAPGVYTSHFFLYVRARGSPHAPNPQRE